MTSRTWPSREEWAERHRTFYADTADDVAHAVSRNPIDYVTSEEIDQAIEALTRTRNALLGPLRAAKQAGDDERVAVLVAVLQDDRRRRFLATKALKAGRIPRAHYEGAGLPELTTITSRYQAAVDAAVDAARRAIVARPIDDAAWERELQRRRNVDQLLGR